MPPHILPSGDSRGPGVAGGGADATGAALAGGGTELTTPVGVNTGIAPAVGAALALAAAVGARAPGAGGECDEQPKAATSDRKATKPCNSRRSFIANDLATRALEVEQ
jgi:hypothetical protein